MEPLSGACRPRPELLITDPISNVDGFGVGVGNVNVSGLNRQPGIKAYLQF